MTQQKTRKLTEEEKIAIVKELGKATEKVFKDKTLQFGDWLMILDIFVISLVDGIIDEMPMPKKDKKLLIIEQMEFIEKKLIDLVDDPNKYE